MEFAEIGFQNVVKYKYLLVNLALQHKFGLFQQ